MLIHELSKNTSSNYSLKMAALSIYCKKVPEQISEEEINGYFEYMIKQTTNE